MDINKHWLHIVDILKSIRNTDWRYSLVFGDKNHFDDAHKTKKAESYTLLLDLAIFNFSCLDIIMYISRYI